jgi:hypothetical protein
MKTRNLVAGVAAFVVVGLMAACGAEPEGGDAVYVVQVARVSGDGNVTVVSERQITASQERAENAARSAGTMPVRVTGNSGGDLSLESVNSDSGCAANDNWLYDQSGQMGNKICLYGTSPFTTCASLSSFAHTGGGTWDEYMVSFWTGNEGGYFTCGDLFCPSGGWSYPDVKYTNCDTCRAGICFTN